MERRWLWILVYCGSCVAGSAHGQTYQGQGTAVGGLAGALIGGIVGHQNDEVAEGALIGGAVGAIAGNIAGAHRDQNVAMHRYYQQQNWYWQQQAQQQAQQRQIAAQRSVSTGDVVSMVRGGISDSVIIGHLQANGVQRRLEVGDIISLHQQGVSEAVIHAMQTAPVGGSVPAYVAAQPNSPPVVVHEHYSVGRPYPPPPVYSTYSYYYGSGGPYPRYRYCR